MTTTRTLDRVVHFDERSRNFPIRAVVNTNAFKTTTWECNTFNDQGQEGACVGFGWSHELASTPAPVPTNNTVAFSLYKRAQQLDPWPGENYSGTSVLAGAKAVQELKNNVGQSYIAEYRWAFGLPDLLLALAHTGPVVLGLNWYEGMFDTDPLGFLRRTGALSGGHCILALGVYIVLVAGFTGEPTQLSHLDLDNSYIVLHNSWGKDWGTGGKAKISLRDMQTLLAEDGEACVPMVRNVDAVISPTDPVPPAPVKPKGKGKFYAVRNSSVFHVNHPGIRENRVFASYAEARRLGLRPCAICRPTE